MRRTLATIALLAVAAGFAGCGSSGKKIPSSNATDLIARLNEAKLRSSGKPDCNGLTSDTIPALQAGVAALPPKTDKDIRDTLREGIDNLRNLVQAKCSQQTTTSSTTSTTSTSTSTSTPTTTQTTTSTSTPPPPPPTHTTTSTQTAPPTKPSGGAGPPPGQAKKQKGNVG
jgi:cell division septation protein DedD